MPQQLTNFEEQREQVASIMSAALDTTPVSGLTHNFYRYPARFSPVFVRSVIEAYSKPGDWIMDPFAGGGTTLVEGMALGRNVIGIDISSLSAFVCEAKTLVLTDEDVDEFKRWQAEIPQTINMQATDVDYSDYTGADYCRNLDGPEFWRFRKAIGQCLLSIARLYPEGSELLARCVLLRTAQWALDAKKKRPTINQFRERLVSMADEMLDSALKFRSQINKTGLETIPQALIFNKATADAHSEVRSKRSGAPNLILTSPPYPGIHVLYHRWQVDGRKETPAPFWIANKTDGAGSSYYTMGSRKNPGLESYFEQLKSNFLSIAKMAGPETTIVQMVAFSEREWQLPKYLQVMEECGLEEVIPWNIDGADRRLWRGVPNRKWHAQQKTRAPGAREVVLIHRKT